MPASSRCRQLVKPIDEQLKMTVLVADKRRGLDLKQIGRIRGEWAAGTSGLVACRWEESGVTLEDAKLPIYPAIKLAPLTG